MSTQNFGFVRSTQIFFTTMGMFIANQGKLLKWVCYGVLMISALVLYLVYSNNVQGWTVFGKYYWVKFIMSLSIKTGADPIIIDWGQARFETTYAKFVGDAWTQGVVGAVWHDIILVGIMAGVAAAGILFFLTWIFTSKGQKITDNKFIRGMRLASNQELVQEMKAKKRVGEFYIPVIDEQGKLIKIPFTPGFERTHLSIHGTTGQGKGQLLMHLLDQIQAMGDKAILYDKGSTYIKHYFNAARKDRVLNGLDERCANWDMWKDAPTSQLMDNIAAALIPEQASAGDPFWVNAARVVFSSAAKEMMTKCTDEERTIETLLNILIVKELAKLSIHLKGTDASSLSDENLEKMAISIRSILVTYCRSLRYMIPVNKKHGMENKFSIRSWLKDKSDKSWLFITCSEDDKEALKPLISVWLDTAVSVMMSMPVDYKGRVWFIYDEIGSLQKLPSLETGLAEIRKFGGCMVLGMQSFSQIEEIYGTKRAQSIFSLLNTRVYFKSPDADTAKLVSADLGEQEIEESRENYSYGTESVRDGISLGTQKVTRRLVDYSEVLILDKMEIYLRMIGDLPITRAKILTKIDRPEKGLAFDPIDPTVKAKLETQSGNFGEGRVEVDLVKDILAGKFSQPDEEVPKESASDEAEFECVVAPDHDRECHDYEARDVQVVKEEVAVKQKIKVSKKAKKPSSSKASKKPKASANTSEQDDNSQETNETNNLLSEQVAPSKKGGKTETEAKRKKGDKKYKQATQLDIENEMVVKEENHLGGL